MNTYQLSCFLAVADSLSFARAAETVNVSQPAITHQIQSLENELNVKLFRRSTRLVEITPEGQAFLNDARNIVMIAQRAKKRFEDPDMPEIRFLRIGCAENTKMGVLPMVLRELRKLHSNLHPSIQTVPHRQLYQQTEDGNFDISFGIREERSKRYALIYKELIRCPLVCVCENTIPLARKDVVTLEDLQSESLIFYDPVNAAPEVAQMQWKLMEGKGPSKLYFCDTGEEAMILTGAGYGVSIMPELFVPRVHDLKTLSIVDTVELSFGAYYKTYQGNEPLRQFIKLMEQYYDKEKKNDRT